MNTARATQIAKSLGYGKVFVRSNGEICMENKSGKVALTMNADFSIKYSRHNMDEEALAIKAAMLEPNQIEVSNNASTPSRRWISGSHNAPGHYVYSSGDYTTDVLSGFFQE